jgi:hypothetical protein
LREIAIGTAVWGDADTTGQVWVLQFGERIRPWRNQGLVIDPAHAGGEVSAIAYSPDYPRDETILVVASTSDDVGAAHRNRTWLCLGERDFEEETTVWNDVGGYPVEVATASSPSAGDAPGVSRISSSLSLPLNYSASREPSRRLFVSYDRVPDANDDVYLLADDTVSRLKAGGGAAIDISSIAYYGTATSGTLLAGDVSPVGASPTVQVRRTSDPFESSPAWDLSAIPPSGPGSAKVSWSPDGELVYCGTSQSPGAALDESAFSKSADADTWQQLSLVDTSIRFSDIAPTPDSKTLFAATFSASGPEGIWRTAAIRSGLGRRWSRQLAIDTASDGLIVRLSPGYASDYTVYVAEAGGDLVVVSRDRGNSWHWRRAPGVVIDMTVEDRHTVHIALPDGFVRKSTNGARIWKDAVDPSLAAINMLAVAGNGTVLVGGRNGDVTYSTDGGATFVRTADINGTGAGDVQVVADANHRGNGIIYAATDLADDGIWRWTIGLSTSWEPIDESITGLRTGQRVGGLAVASEGTLYALRMEPGSSTSGGITRSLNPSEPYLTDVEFDFVNRKLPGDTAFDPTAVFANTLPYLKLSGDSRQNDLWAIDTTNQTVYQFQDSFSKLGPTPETPSAEAIIPIDSSGRITSLSLSWEELSRTRKYEIAIYLDRDAEQPWWSGTSTTTGILAAGGGGGAQLTSGTTYYWRVRSIEPILSRWSDTRSFTPALGGAQWSPLAVSTLATPLPGATSVPIRPGFTWSSASGAASYEFVLARDLGFTDIIVAMTGADALPTTAWASDRDLDYSTSYFWKVRAVNAASHSEWGTSVFTTEAAPAAPPPAQPSPPPSPPPAPAPLVPRHLLWLMVGIGATLVIGLVILIVGTRG